MPSSLGGDQAVTPLREAKASQAAAARSRAAFWFFTMMTLFFTLVALAAWPVGVAGKLLLLVMAMAPAALAVKSRATATGATTDAREAIEKAWLAAAEDAAGQATSGVTVAELAARLKVDPAKAEQLLTQLAVHERTRIDVDDDAEIRYSIPGAQGASKIRVGTSEAQFLALEQAEAEAARGVNARGERRLTAEEDAMEQKRLATSPFARSPRGPRGAGR